MQWFRRRQWTRACDWVGLAVAVSQVFAYRMHLSEKTGTEGIRPGSRRAVRQELEWAFKLKFEFRGRRQAREAPTVSRGGHRTRHINQQRTGSLRPFSLFPPRRKRLRAAPPAQSLKTNQSTAQ